MTYTKRMHQLYTATTVAVVLLSLASFLDTREVAKRSREIVRLATLVGEQRSGCERLVSLASDGVHAQPTDKRKGQAEKLRQELSRFVEGFNALLRGDQSQIAPPLRNPEATRRLEGVSADVQELVKTATRLDKGLSQESKTEPNLTELLERLSEQQSRFSSVMARVATDLEVEARNQGAQWDLRRVLFLLLILSALLLLAKFVVQPLFQRSITLLSERDASIDRTKASLDRIARSRKLLSQALASLGTELRTSLVRVEGALHNTGGGGDPSEAKPEIEAIRQRLSDLMDVAAIESEQAIVSEATPTNLPELLAGCVERFREEATDRGIAIRLDLDPNLTEPIEADSETLQLCVDELIRNAVKFTDYGSVTVAAELETENSVAISVEDTGVGLAAGERAAAMQPFFQLKSATDRSAPGIGIGLYLVANRVAQMRGRFQLGGALEQGTRATITLPRGRSGSEVEVEDERVRLEGSVAGSMTSLPGVSQHSGSHPQAAVG